MDRKEMQNARLYLLAAQSGDAFAQCNIAWFYLNGTGVKQDKVAAFQWFQKAAEQNNLRGLYNMGLCYDNGDGVHKDRVQAVEWYKKAAARGHAGALYKLGEFTERGLAGLGPDIPKALDYYRQAAAKGSQVAKEAMERLSGKGGAVNAYPGAKTDAPEAETPKEAAKGKRRQNKD